MQIGLNLKSIILMERVGTLLQKLQEQFGRQAPADQLLLTVQQLNAELMHLQKGISGDKGVTVVMPMSSMKQQDVIATAKDEPVPVPAEEEKTVQVLQVDEAEIEAELEDIRRKSEEVQRLAMHSKPVVIFENEDEVPTLAHQQEKKISREINDVNEKHLSVNDKLKQGTIELGDQLVESSIRDLRKAIGVNDRFVFINELFRGDESMYERSIRTINGFSILPEAEYWIQRELKVKLGWNEKSETLLQFNQLIKRRFT
ncbi:MAG: hypothetical protein ABJA78_03120 [Ferruginibacter sp.]